MSHELHQLVIKNLAILEQAPGIVYEVDNTVFSAIDEKMKAWVEKQSSWEGVFSYLDDRSEHTIFWPSAWGRYDESDCIAYYSSGFSDEDFSYSSSSLVGVVKQRYGIWVCVNQKAITKLSGKGQAAKWKTFLAEKFVASKLGERGFELDGAYLFLPIRIDAEELAEAYPDSLDEALVPIDEALAKLEAAHSEIDALLQSALQHQF